MRDLHLELAPDKDIANELCICVHMLEINQRFIDVQKQVDAMCQVMAPHQESFFCKETGRFVRRMSRADKNRSQIPTHSSY